MPSPLLKSAVSALLCALLAAAASAATLAISPEQLVKKGSAEVALLAGDPAVITLRFDDPRNDSGVRLIPPAGEKAWDFSGARVLSADVENLSGKQLRLTMAIASDASGEKASTIDTGIALNPGEKRAINLLITQRGLYPSPEGVKAVKTVDARAITSIEFYMQWPFEVPQPGLVNCKISNLRLEGKPDASTAVAADKFFPFIDGYGQYVHGDWPAKIHADGDLKKEKAREDAELDALPAPKSWDRFGGWADGPLLKATGNFRVEKYQGKWWFVDPEGRLFFSTGLDVLRTFTDATQSAGHEKWFAFPVTTPELPFTKWNLEKKYGAADYDAAFYDTLARRLPAWGINSIGNWASLDFVKLDKVPYTLPLSSPELAGVPRLTKGKVKFYDVFDPAYIRAMKTLLPGLVAKNPVIAKSVTDPMCIGYFIDNELNFGNRGRQILGDIVLESPARQAAKKQFAADLKAKYRTIDALNASWKTDYADWQALLSRTDEVPASDGYKADSETFFQKTLDQYFRLCRDAIKATAPNRLYLGCRFISTDAPRKDLCEASKKYCDVLTLNVYAHSVANFGLGGFPDMPVLIGEFHFGVLDRGMFHPGIPAGMTQEERALAYARFLQGALSNPLIVGAHWFQFRDQPLTGRWDGEGYAIGFVDVADTPYRHLTAAARQIGETMYPYRAGGKPATP